MSDLLKSQTVHCKWHHYWPMLISPLSLLYVYFVIAIDRPELCSRNFHENIAMFLIEFSFVTFAVTAYHLRSELHAVLAVLSGAFFSRNWVG